MVSICLLDFTYFMEIDSKAQCKHQASNDLVPPKLGYIISNILLTFLPNIRKIEYLFNTNLVLVIIMMLIVCHIVKFDVWIEMLLSIFCSSMVKK